MSADYGGQVSSLARVVLHIGGSKTASTSLQNGVFMAAPEAHHFGEFGDGVTTLADERVVRSILEVDDAFYDAPAACDLFARHLAAAGTGTLVFSSADVLHANQPTLAARRLKQLVGGDATVLLVVRNQYAALASYYAGHGAWLKPAPHPYYRAFISFDDWLRQQWLLLPDSRLRTFAYWEQLAPFITEFGRDQVQVTCLEDLVRGDADSWSKIGELVGLSAGEALRRFRDEHQREGITQRQLLYGQALGLLLPLVSTPDVRNLRGRVSNFLKGGRKFLPTWTGAQLDRLADLYGNGNSHLQRTFDLNLEAWRYPGAPGFEHVEATYPPPSGE